MKKILAILLAVVMVFSVASVSFAGFKEEAVLQFDENGNFKVMVLADIQTGYPVPDDMITFIYESVDFAQPDLIVLCGDNINTEEVEAYDDVFNALDRTGVPYTAVLGNHDEESSGGLTRDEIIERYASYENCLVYDADPSLHGAGTHNLPVLSSDGSKSHSISGCLTVATTYTIQRVNGSAMTGFVKTRLNGTMLHVMQ